MKIILSETRNIPQKAILNLYRQLHWSSANKPDALYEGLMNSHSLVTAWDGDLLVGLGNAISDGALVVYYPHLAVHPDYQGKGIGRRIVALLSEKYKGFHQQVLVADGQAVGFYQKCGFEKAGQTVPLWVYKGDEH
jgi:GNAT superfamily N-acetyltransferase